MRLVDKVAIISGAASGMGAATARMFAREATTRVWCQPRLGRARLVSRRNDRPRLASPCLRKEGRDHPRGDTARLREGERSHRLVTPNFLA